MNPVQDHKRVLEPGRFSEIRSLVGRQEALLSPHATISADASRRHNRIREDIRTPYSRDADRIIHTRAYSRYIDKTQVFYLIENDHITHRVIHVQLGLTDCPHDRAVPPAQRRPDRGDCPRP